MDMARDRKAVNLSLDPEMVRRMREWCDQHEPKIALGRAMDTAMREFLQKREDDD